MGKLLIAVSLFFSLLSLKAQDNTPLIFENKEAKLVVQTLGSVITEFVLKNKPINPLSWKLRPDQMPKNNQSGPPFAGHFLCVGRWGSPSEGEIAAGIPHNSEANTLSWSLVDKSSSDKSKTTARWTLSMPLDQYKVTRKVHFPTAGSWFLMEERFENLLSTARLSNVVQHVTIGPPFLNNNTLVDCNATVGFDQRTAISELEKQSFIFPHASLVDGPADLRKTNDDRGYCTTHLVPDSAEFGWVTATHVESGLVLGYVWKQVDYPWLNLWHHKEAGNPVAHGLEFGTTGLGKPYQVLLENDVNFFGKKSWFYLDAKAAVKKQYIGFLTKVPSNFKGVKSLKYGKGGLMLTEQGDKPRTVLVTLPENLLK